MATRITEDFGSIGGGLTEDVSASESGAKSESRASLLTHVRRLESSSRDQREFMNFVAHEIRAPLAVIRGYCEMMISEDLGPLPPMARRAMAIVLSKAEGLDDLGQSLVEATRAEGGVISFKLLPTDLGRLAGEVAEAFAGDPLHRDCAIRVRGRAQAALADPIKLGAALHNLLSNAAKYGPAQGPIDILIAERAGHIQVSVSDRGPGIPPRLRPRLFRRFERLPQPGEGRVPGTGLGLYITRAYVEGMGGEVWVTGRRGGGASFKIALTPAAPPYFRDGDHPRDSADGGRGGPEEGGRARG